MRKPWNLLQMHWITKSTLKIKCFHTKMQQVLICPLQPEGQLKIKWGLEHLSLHIPFFLTGTVVPYKTSAQMEEICRPQGTRTGLKFLWSSPVMIPHPSVRRWFTTCFCSSSRSKEWQQFFQWIQWVIYSLSTPPCKFQVTQQNWEGLFILKEVITPSIQKMFNMVLENIRTLVCL